MPDSVFGLKVGDYVLWRGPDSDSAEMIGKVVRIHEKKLVKEVRDKLGIPIKGEPYAVIELENGVLMDLEEKTRSVVKKASDSGIDVVLIHFEDVDMIKSLAGDFRQVDWIIPHMGFYKSAEEMKSYCELARDNGNVFLDTSGAQYHRFGEQFQWSGIEKILFASDGSWFSPHVERAKIEILQLPTLFRTPKLTDQELDMILGGNLARMLQT